MLRKPPPPPLTHTLDCVDINAFAISPQSGLCALGYFGTGSTIRLNDTCDGKVDLARPMSPPALLAQGYCLTRGLHAS